eukprot:scaffold232314_cov32-Tisochrysis_lutea.AAC.2
MTSPLPLAEPGARRERAAKVAVASPLATAPLALTGEVMRPVEQGVLPASEHLANEKKPPPVVEPPAEAPEGPSFSTLSPRSPSSNISTTNVRL